MICTNGTTDMVLKWQLLDSHLLADLITLKPFDFYFAKKKINTFILHTRNAELGHAAVIHY